MHLCVYAALAMATKNPRLTITLQPALAAQLRRLSELTGNSQSALISELLDGSGPVFDRLIKVLEAAEAAKDSMKGGVARDMRDAQQRVEQQLGLMLDFGEGIAADLVDAAETIKRRRAKGALARDARPQPAAAAETPPSNRGVRSLTKSRKSSIQTRG